MGFGRFDKFYYLSNLKHIIKIVSVVKKKILLLALSISALTASAADTALWLRDVKISPQGDRIAFEYKGDIWTVPVAGGNATRLTTLSSYESTPVWSPDGSQIAFASDRHGNFDVFVMPSTGGAATRLTTNSASELPEAFSADGKSIYFSAAIQSPAESRMFPSGRMTQLYTVPVAGGKTVQVLPTPAKNLSFSTDGGIMLYQDVKGMENEWRKHHTSSVTRDIWSYDFKTGKHTNLTDRPGEDRDPNYDAATGTVYMISEPVGGTMNVYSFPISNPKQLTALTNFNTHPVRFLSRANNGTLAFTYDGEIYTMRAGASPVKLAVTAVSDDEESVKRISLTPKGAVPSPDGKMVAFVSRGDIFVTSVEYETTYRVTNTAQAEKSISWGSDSRTLYYSSDRDGERTIYKAEMTRKDDRDFANATGVKETRLFNDDAEYSHPTVSPDGKKLAYVKNRTEIWVRDLASGSDRQLTKGETYPGYDDGIVMVWNPDSRFMALEMVPEMHDPYTDIAILDTETGVLTNITESAYFDASPRFTQDGNAVLFISERYGMRNHASWGSQYDVMMAFLNREAFDRFNLSKEDFSALDDDKDKGEKEDNGKKDKKGKKDSKKDKDGKKSEAKSKTTLFEADGIDTRTVRITPYSSDLCDVIATDDGETIYYLSAFEDGYDLWKVEPRSEDAPEVVKKLGMEDPASFAASKDGKKMFLFGKSLKKMDASGKLTAIDIDGKQDIDPVKEREAMYDFMAREEAKRFYTPDMHGVDWDAMTTAYRKFLPHINNNYDFSKMLSELLGELNVSHTGSGYRPGGVSAADRTASLGLLYDMNYQGEGLKVAEVIVGGPFDKAASKMRPGAVITAVAGQTIDDKADLGDIFNNIAGKKTLVSFTDATGSAQQEVVIPVGAGTISDLMYNRWVKRNEALVDSLSGGRLAYVHIPEMSDDGYRPMYSKLLGKYVNRDGVVVDIRFNGGGRLHEDVEVLLSGEKYLTQEIRGKEVCDMPSRRWNKPSIMLIAEPCYSNAHGTPWVYKHQNLGRLVGMPVPGTMTSVNWVTLQDPSLYFGIPVIGYRTAEGNFLENTQLEPDVKVVNTPESIAAGRDLQLERAVKELLDQLDGKN